MLYKKLCKACVLLPICVACFHLFMGVLTTGILRAQNPLKKLSHDSKRIYLTFDDGVDPIYTPMLLDLLQKHHVKASFFVLASSAQKYPQLLLRMKKEGHIVGLHSFAHKNQILQLPHQVKQDFDQSMKIFDAMGSKPAYYRPPWGHSSLWGVYFCRTYHLKTVLWNVIVQDWQADTTVELLCKKLTRKVHGNAVICMHDGRGKEEAPRRTIGALAKMIPKWKEEGYTFETVDYL